MLGTMFLWVTRSSPFNLLTADQARAAGHNVLPVPLLNVLSLKTPRLEATPDGLVFTSLHGVRFHPFEDRFNSFPVYASNHEVAEAARVAGYTDVQAANSVLDLERLVPKANPVGSILVHLCNQSDVDTLPEKLAVRGISLIRRPVYKTEYADTADVEAAMRALPLIQGITVHSPKAAAKLAEIITRWKWSGIVFSLCHGCTSELRQVPDIFVETARRPSEESLNHLLWFFRGRGVLDPASSVRASSARLLQTANDNGEPTRSFKRPEIDLLNDGPDDPSPSAA